MSGDLISRQAVLDLIEHCNSDGLGSVFYGYEEGEKFADAVNKLSPINSQEPSEWCTDCKEYDQDEHCCHRFSKVIRDTVEEMKQESVLDKIRAWIDKPVIRDEYSQRQNDYCDGYEFVCNQIREIIDMHKVEMEE